VTKPYQQKGGVAARSVRRSAKRAGSDGRRCLRRPYHLSASGSRAAQGAHDVNENRRINLGLSIDKRAHAQHASAARKPFSFKQGRQYQQEDGTKRHGMRQQNLVKHRAYNTRTVPRGKRGEIRARMALNA